MKSHNEIINDDITLNLSQVIYGKYVKLDRLKDLVYNTYGNSSIEYATKLNIFIDITSILHPLYSEKNRITYNNITDVSSGIINMCAHYRGFFRGLKVETKFYLINSLNCNALNIKYYANYNLTFKNKTIVTKTKPMIDNNLSLLKILCPYLPGIYYIDSPDNYETSVIIAYLIETLNDGNPNLVISHDMYSLQLPALYKYTSYLYPIKSRIAGGSADTSWMLPINEKPGFKEQFWQAVAKYRNISYNSIYDISPVNYALFTALTKCPERSIIGNCRSSISATKFIKTLVGTEDIKINSIQFLNNEELVAKYPVAEIQSLYNAIDIQHILSYYRISPEANQIKLLDLNDSETVNRISAKYYSNNPLDLYKL